MSSVAEKQDEIQPKSDDGRLPARLSCSQTRLPFALDTAKQGVRGGAPVLPAPQQADRYEFSCSHRPADCVNGFVTNTDELCVEVYYGDIDGHGDYSGHDVLLSREDALAFAAWIYRAYGVTP